MCDLNHEFAETEGLWFQFINGKLMVPIYRGAAPTSLNSLSLLHAVSHPLRSILQDRLLAQMAVLRKIIEEDY